MVAQIPEVEEVSDDVCNVQQAYHVCQCLVECQVFVELATDTSTTEL